MDEINSLSVEFGYHEGNAQLHQNRPPFNPLGGYDLGMSGRLNA